MLADADEPLILADGTRIDCSTGKTIKDKKERPKFVVIPSASEAQEIVAKTRRSISQLPLPSNQMNAVSLVLFYTLWGLANQDIAIAAGLSIDQVKNIKKLDQYKELLNDIQQSVLEIEIGDIRAYFQKNAINAAEKIVTIAEEDEGVLGFKAAQDVLDRAGHRPADIVQHRHTMENSLQVEYISKKPIEDVPTIEATYKDIT